MVISINTRLGTEIHEVRSLSLGERILWLFLLSGDSKGYDLLDVKEFNVVE